MRTLREAGGADPAFEVRRVGRVGRTLAAAAVASVLLAPHRALAEDAGGPGRETGASGARTMAVEECVAAALARNVDVLASEADVDLAEAQRNAVRGEFLPKVHADGTYQRWNEPYVFGGFPVHEASVWNVTATVTQPITPLFAIYDAFKVRELGVDVAVVRREARRREIAMRVVEGYYRLLQVGRLAEVAVASVDQLQAQLRQANSFHTNGLVSQDDVLRAQLAVAGAEQRLIQTRSRVALDRARLAVLMGMPADAAVEPKPLPTDASLARDPVSLEDAERTAAAERVELRELDRRMQQADHDTRLAYLKLAPQVSVVGAYIHNEGSLFSQTNSAYVGGVASWDVWDWGTTTSGISEAKARARQAALARAKLAQGIRLEVRQAFVDVGAANEAMQVARVEVASADENFRLVKKRYEANAATSFDVVDAEALLTQARGQMQTALYDFVIARAALRAAMGSSPQALTQ
jgi:outer membrane protein